MLRNEKVTPQHLEVEEESRNLNHYIVCNVPYIGDKMHSAPLSDYNDGANDIILQSADKTRK